MMYEFESAFGERIEREYSPDDVPEVGNTIKVDDTTYTRVFSQATFIDSRKGSIKFPRFESHQLPRNWKHHKDNGGLFSPEGKPRFSSKAQIDEAMAAARHEGTEIAYGEL